MLFIARKFQAVAMHPAGLAAQGAAQFRDHIHLDTVMLERPARHGDGAEPVELVAELLPFLPREEIVEVARLQTKYQKFFGSFFQKRTFFLPSRSTAFP
jgi:hypothetical protein